MSLIALMLINKNLDMRIIWNLYIVIIFILRNNKATFRIKKVSLKIIIALISQLNLIKKWKNFISQKVINSKLLIVIF